MSATDAVQSRVWRTHILDRPVFGVGSHDARSVRVSAIRFSSLSPCFNSIRALIGQRAPHLNVLSLLVRNPAYFRPHAKAPAL